MGDNEALVLLEAASADVASRTKQIEQLIEQLPDLPTDTLVSGFVRVNAAAKALDGFAEHVKKELVTNAKDGVPASGRFMSEDVDTDEKGHRYLYGLDGESLQAQKRVSTKFDAEAAAEYLTDHGLLDLGVETIEALPTLDAVRDARDELLRLLDEVYTGIVTLDAQCYGLLKAMVQSLVTEKQVVTEARVEALVVLGKIPTEDVEQFMKTVVTYAVIPPKEKKR